jgi:phosphatidylinositol glycan class V
MPPRCQLVLSGFLLSNALFVLSAVCFFKLSATVLRDRQLALAAARLYCFNPASIFHSAM